MSAVSVSKVLSENDTGQTGSHQVGILVPKDSRVLGFFPKLGGEEKNPRARLAFLDGDGRSWSFTFVYYNSKHFGGTRNEYRLTRMTEFIRTSRLRAGDELVFSLTDDGQRTVKCLRQGATQTPSSSVLRLDAGWKVIRYRGRS